ncbi:unnamed protein product [Pieris brassicae]|uniref:Uncharacterized protein n=1 Tax=Pieris brassicae TaxID=7116 RepID=A0A9P0T7U5_PIEBR|nr:unnamed protein product [Pieris brassicae]
MILRRKVMRPVYLDQAHAQAGASRWTDCRAARYLRSPVPPSPLPSGTGWHSKTKRSTKDVPRMFAPPNASTEGSPPGGCFCLSGDYYTTPDSRAENLMIYCRRVTATDIRFGIKRMSKRKQLKVLIRNDCSI